MLLKKIEMVVYIVSDWSRAKEFYGQILELPVAGLADDDFGWMEFGEKDGTHLAIRKWNRPEPLPNRDGGGTVIFMVEDVHKVVNELRSRGVQCDEVVAIPEMVTYANFYDPDGNRMQVSSFPAKR